MKFIGLLQWKAFGKMSIEKKMSTWIYFKPTVIPSIQKDLILSHGQTEIFLLAKSRERNLTAHIFENAIAQWDDSIQVLRLDSWTTIW
jgi:hypothetical protein